MLRGRARLPVLAEVSGPTEAGPWSLRRSDFAALGEALPRLAGRRLVAIAGEGEAPAVAAIALAAAASASGRRAILVECDVARPRLAGQLGLTAAPGLHEYLRWEAEPQSILQPLALAGPAAAGSVDPLACICAGRPASKAETLLGLQSFSHMAAKLRGAYELTLLLSPPLLAEPAAAFAVAAQADAVVAGMVAAEASGRAGRGVRAAVKRLPVPVLGAVAIAG
jgi:polysaccharide biosynthesis transport protein